MMSLARLIVSAQETGRIFPGDSVKNNGKMYSKLNLLSELSTLALCAMR